MAIRNPNLSDPYEYMAAEGRNIIYQPSLTVQPRPLPLGSASGSMSSAVSSAMQPSLTVQPRPSAPLPQPGIISGSTPTGPLASVYDSGPITSMTGPNIGGNSIVPILRPPETPLTPATPITSSFDSINSTLEGLTKDQNRLSSNISDLTSQYGDLSTGLLDLTADYQNLGNKFEDYNNQFGDFRSAYDKQMSDYGTRFDQMSQGIGSLTSDYDDIQDKMQTIENTSADFSEAVVNRFGQVEGRVGSLEDKVNINPYYNAPSSGAYGAGYGSSYQMPMNFGTGYNIGGYNSTGYYSPTTSWLGGLGY